MTGEPVRPMLLYNDECAVCRFVAGWVRASARSATFLDVRPIGADPQALARLHPGLDIWDAYAIVHLLMPDGSMNVGGAAVAEVLRRLPATRWLAAIIDLHVGSFRPGALVVDAAYTVLAESRPFLGCESCGSGSALAQSVHHALRWLAQAVRADRKAISHFASALHRHPRATP